MTYTNRPANRSDTNPKEALLDITDYLPNEYKPVYGTGVTADSFRPLDSEDYFGWNVEALNRLGKTGNYTITVEPVDASGSQIADSEGVKEARIGENLIQADATCDVEIDGIQTPVQHPYTKRFGGVASIVDWYDAIALEDAEGRRSRQATPWSGNDMGSVLARVEHSIVAYGSEEVAVDSFSTANEIANWLESALSETEVRAEVWHVSNAFEDDQAEDRTMLRRYEDDEVTGWAPIPFSTGFISKEWIHHFFGDGQPSPFAHLQMSGTQRISLNADYALSWQELGESADLTDGNAILESGSDDWLVIHIVESDVVLPLPWPGANLSVHHDADGANVGIDVLVTELQEKHYRKERLWESEWGRFLDESVTLNEAEVSNGIRRAETALSTLLKEEEE